MSYKYQLIFLGTKSAFLDKILNVFWKHIDELGIKREHIQIIDSSEFSKTYNAAAPSFVIYFGNTLGKFEDIKMLEVLVGNSTPILPIVTDLRNFTNQCPSLLINVNGFELRREVDIEKLVSVILEAFSLLRKSRKVFISYKRDESSTVAIQLFEQLEKNGFDVFLDTHSVRPGQPFQEELWHRLADSDVLLLLNTPGFLRSKWTTLELAKANALALGILQLIWPSSSLELGAQLTIPLQLTKLDFGNAVFFDRKNYLTEKAILNITSKVESLRARSLASRQYNLIAEFIAYARKLGRIVSLQSEGYMTMDSISGNQIKIIPSVGIPQAITYNESESRISSITSEKLSNVYLLYDHRNVRDKWVNHLEWLDLHLPVKTIKVTNSEEWIKKA